MNKIIEFLSSVKMLWISGILLAMSFVTQYIVPIAGGTFTFIIDPAWGSLFISGIPITYYAVLGVMAKKIKSSLLITIAMIAAAAIGDIFAAGEVAFIMAIGELLEEKTVAKAKKGIKALFDLVPNTGRLITINKNGDETEKNIQASELKKGNVIRVLPGETFAADGVIISGVTTADQSILTGESLPVDKQVGDMVFAGTYNRFGSVDIEVSKSFDDSSLQKMIKLVEDAENNKAPMQRIADKWAGWLVPMACIIAILTYIIIALPLNAPDVALIRAVTVLVVFCPCALALATPTSIMAAIGQATKFGVLIKSGEALEKMGEINVVAFDKTGTITKGMLEVSDVIEITGKKDNFLPLTVSVESRSEHPIGKAIIRYGQKNKITKEDVSDFLLTVGKGVSANVLGEKILCGNEKMILEDANIEIDNKVQTTISDLRSQGKAVVLIAKGKEILGIIGLADTIKENSKTAIDGLTAAGVNKTVLLTGDNEKAAHYISEKVGINEVYASLLPEGKVEMVKKLQSENTNICMVGDGVNDAPALKTATVGIAMGTMGSDIAIDAADIALMGDDISKIGYLKKLSNGTVKFIKVNIAISMIINIVAVFLSVAGVLNPVTGALIHNAGSVLVVLNAARLYNKKF